MIRNFLFLFILFSPSFVVAEDLWVCLGSYEEERDARTYASAIRYEFADELTVAEADTPAGRYFRVVLGPFDGPRSREALVDARRVRPDAWIVAMVRPSEPSADASALQPAALELGPGPASPPTLQDRSKPPSKAPADYGTHRLKR